MISASHRVSPRDSGPILDLVLIPSSIPRIAKSTAESSVTIPATSFEIAMMMSAGSVDRSTTNSGLREAATLQERTTVGGSIDVLPAISIMPMAPRSSRWKVLADRAWRVPSGVCDLGPAAAPSATFAGMDSVHGGGKVTDFSDFCTTGFTVEHRISGVEGVTTAGRCPNNLTYTTGGSQTINFVSEYDAYWGDGQWHSLGSGVSVEPKFYVNSTTLRTLISFRFRHEISVGQTLCSFGRGTNSIICDDVYSVGSACGGNSYMVLMEERQATGGDSGAPWFSGSIGYGTHKGYTWLWGSRDCFSTMDLIWSVMNLSPLTG